MNKIQLTLEEIQALLDAIEASEAVGFAESDADPIVTATEKLQKALEENETR